MVSKRPAARNSIPRGANWTPHPQSPGPKPREIDRFTNLPKEDTVTKEESYYASIFINTIGALVFGFMLGMVSMVGVSSNEVQKLRSELLREKLVNQGLLDKEINKND